MPHPPSEPPTASTPRTPRLTRTHAYVNTAADQSHAAAGLSQTRYYASISTSQSQAADVENTVMIGQKQRAERGVRDSGATDRHMMTTAVNHSRASVDYDEHRSEVDVNSSRNVRNSNVTSTAQKRNVMFGKILRCLLVNADKVVSCQ